MPKLNRTASSIYYEVHGDERAGRSCSRTAIRLVQRHVGGPDRAVLEGLQADHLGHARPRRQPTIRTTRPHYTEESHRRRHGGASWTRSARRRRSIGGLSLGGYMSLAFHLAHPERDRGAADHRHRARLQATTSRGTGWNATSIRRAERCETRRTADAGGASAEMRTAPPPLRRRPGQGGARHADPARRRRDRFSLPTIAGPVAGGGGRQRHAVPRRLRLHGRQDPRARRRWCIPDAGHAANIDQPAAFNRAVLGFLDGLHVRA